MRKRPLTIIDVMHDPALFGNWFKGTSWTNWIVFQGRNVGDDKSISNSRQIIEIDIFDQRHAPGMNPEDFAASRLIGNPDHNFTIEPSGPPESFVNRLGPVGRSDDDHVLARFPDRRRGSPCRRPRGRGERIDPATRALVPHASVEGLQ